MELFPYNLISFLCDFSLKLYKNGIKEVFMATKKYPVLYATSIKGTIYHHSGIYNTLYFKVYENEDCKSKPFYEEYMILIQDEIIKAIQNKFTMSQPLKVTNDRIPFVIFRGNIDMKDVQSFCHMILQELEFHCQGIHKADIATLECMFLEIDREPNPFKFNKKGEKLTQTNILDSIMTRIDGHDNPQDNGILTPYSDFVHDKEIELQQKKEEEELEEVVTW